MFTYKQASNQDVELIESLLLTKIDELAQVGVKQWDDDEVLWKNLAKDYEANNFYFVYKNEDVIGMFCVVDYDPGYWRKDIPKEALYIHKVMVLNKASKQGASGYILDVFKELGRQAHVKSVKLDVRAHKDKLRAYYERNGFELVRIEDLGFGYQTALYEFIL